MTDKLKPCPFCGGKAEYLICSKVNEEFQEGVIHCERCGTKTTLFEDEHDRAFDNFKFKSWESQARSAWNSRVSEKQ